ncbi:hypothetical protein EXIGLDRAFT_19068 [Exidia glandulosa HHB12029]|uniref:RRM domain-containing protein n=1 Tax=Exidia glandulosa HHB12029 TaxID=1314781 RepID=A0A165QXD1_EXIGL|nr:hypothetical protein EXIGLDRAFT_19068 [Exidia glandulosa HHB12029]
MHYLNPAVSPLIDSFPTQKQSQSLYNALSPLAQDIPELDAGKSGMNGYHTGQFRPPAPFNGYNNPRPRQQAGPPGSGGAFRDSFSQAHPTAADVFGPAHIAVQQPQHLAHGDALSPTRMYEFDIATLSGLPSAKGHFGGVPLTQDARFGSGSSLLQSQQVQISKSSHVPAAQPPQQQQQQPPFMAAPNFTMPNGIPPPPPQPQFPAHPSAVQAAGPNLPPAGQNASGEEISTIFVVGFPEDMQEREFQNMFTFSKGFEAATLKIPNKDSNAYGAATAQQANPQQRQNGFGSFSAGQMGFGSDGYAAEAQWPPTHPDDHFGRPPDHAPTAQAPTMPPRKQIIGFAKFKTRVEALEARDVLQGRRVDIEKGAVLKAEMAKKNLHTKRGVGPLGLPMSLVGAGATVGPDTLAGLAGINGLVSPHALGNSEALTQRERELGALGAMGLASVAPRPRERDEVEEKLRRATLAGPPGVPVALVRREEERRRENDAAKLRQNAAAYDAWNSVPAQPPRPQGGTVVSPAETAAMASFPFPPPTTGPAPLGGAAMASLSSQDVFAPAGTAATWGLAPGKPERFMSRSGRPPSESESSPPADETNFPPYMTASMMGMEAPSNTAFSPTGPPSQLPSIPTSSSARSYSPPSGDQNAGGDTRSVLTSSNSSVVGSQSSENEEMGRSVVSNGTNNDTTSPQPASPASGGSSITTNMNPRPNVSDQNPPVRPLHPSTTSALTPTAQINTLYVGNLPTSPPPGYPPNQLEESLRTLFQRCTGYRKLCFRQKSNGPMCFVEFDDVQYASKAMNDLYGDTLGGLVKNGIRLSYSKNPLGVRTQPVGGTVSPVNGRLDQPHPGPIGIQEVFQSGRHMSPVHSPPPTSLPMEIGHGRPRGDDAYGGFAASPPSRFFPSPPPGPHPRPAFGPPQQPQFVRPNAFGGLSTNVFGPIGTFSPASPPPMPQGIPPSALHDTIDERFMSPRDLAPHAMTPSPGLEVARAA